MSDPLHGENHSLDLFVKLVTGSDRPTGNEQQLWQAGRQRRDLAARVTSLVNELRSMQQELTDPSTMAGEGGSAASANLGDLVTHGEQVAKQLEQYGWFISTYGSQVQQMRVSAYLMGAFLAIQFASLSWQFYLFVSTGNPVAALLTAALWQRVLQTTQLTWQKFFAKMLISIAKTAMMLSVPMVGIDAFTQAIQTWQHHRQHVDGDALLHTFLGTAAFGGILGMLGPLRELLPEWQNPIQKGLQELLFNIGSGGIAGLGTLGVEKAANPDMSVSWLDLVSSVTAGGIGNMGDPAGLMEKMLGKVVPKSLSDGMAALEPKAEKALTDGITRVGNFFAGKDGMAADPASGDAVSPSDGGAGLNAGSDVSSGDHQEVPADVRPEDTVTAAQPVRTESDGEPLVPHPETGAVGTTSGPTGHTAAPTGHQEPVVAPDRAPAATAAGEPAAGQAPSAHRGLDLGDGEPPVHALSPQPPPGAISHDLPTTGQASAETGSAGPDHQPVSAGSDLPPATAGGGGHETAVPHEAVAAQASVPPETHPVPATHPSGGQTPASTHETAPPMAADGSRPQIPARQLDPPVPDGSRVPTSSDVPSTSSPPPEQIHPRTATVGGLPATAEGTATIPEGQVPREGIWNPADGATAEPLPQEWVHLPENVPGHGDVAVPSGAIDAAPPGGPPDPPAPGRTGVDHPGPVRDDPVSAAGPVRPARPVPTESTADARAGHETARDSSLERAHETASKQHAPGDGPHPVPAAGAGHESLADQVIAVLRHEAGRAIAHDFPDVAKVYDDIATRSGPDVPEHQRLVNVDDAAVKELLLHGSDADAVAAIYELIRRYEQKGLRFTQLAAVEAMMRGEIVNMAAGEGKSLAFLGYGARKAVQPGVDAVKVITTRDNLASREHERASALLGSFGFDVIRMNPDGLLPPRIEGRPTIYLGTHEDVAFSSLRDKPVPGRHAAVDEFDEAFVYARNTFLLSEGVQGPARPEVVAGVRWAHDLVKNVLTEQDFGRVPGQRRGGTALTEAGRQRAAQLAGRPLSEAEHKWLDMAGLARWEYVEGKHYVVHEDKAFIIDPVTHKVMVDPKTSSESRWNGGLAQAIEAKHGLTVRADPASTRSITSKELYTKETHDSVVGASGTANGKEDLFAEQGFSGHVADIPRYHEHGLKVGDDRIFPDQEAKLDALADNTAQLQETGRPQLILAHENDFVQRVSDRLTERGVNHVAIDARWFLKQGVHAEAEFQRIIDQAGQKGAVAVVNMQGARGVDIPLDAVTRDLGGLHVSVTARSALSRDVDIQAENRAARNGEPGSVQYYLSPDDNVYRLNPDDDVDLVTVRYTDAVGSHRADPTPETADAVAQAEQNLRDLASVRQAEASARLGIHLPPLGMPHAPPVRAALPAVGEPRSDALEPEPPPPHAVPADEPGVRTSLLDKAKWTGMSADQFSAFVSEHARKLPAAEVPEFDRLAHQAFARLNDVAALYPDTEAFDAAIVATTHGWPDADRAAFVRAASAQGRHFDELVPERSAPAGQAAPERLAITQDGVHQRLFDVAAFGRLSPEQRNALQIAAERQGHAPEAPSQGPVADGTRHPVQRPAPAIPGLAVAGWALEPVRDGLLWLRPPGASAAGITWPAETSRFSIIVGAPEVAVPGRVWDAVHAGLAGSRGARALRLLGWRDEPLVVLPAGPGSNRLDEVLRGLADSTGNWVFTPGNTRWESAAGGGARALDQDGDPGLWVSLGPRGTDARPPLAGDLNGLLAEPSSPETAVVATPMSTSDSEPEAPEPSSVGGLTDGVLGLLDEVDRFNEVSVSRPADAGAELLHILTRDLPDEQFADLVHEAALEQIRIFGPVQAFRRIFATGVQTVVRGAAVHLRLKPAEMTPAEVAGHPGVRRATQHISTDTVTGSTTVTRSIAGATGLMASLANAGGSFAGLVAPQLEASTLSGSSAAKITFGIGLAAGVPADVVPGVVGLEREIRVDPATDVDSFRGFLDRRSLPDTVTVLRPSLGGFGEVGPAVPVEHAKVADALERVPATFRSVSGLDEVRQNALDAFAAVLPRRKVVAGSKVYEAIRHLTEEHTAFARVLDLLTQHVEAQTFTVHGEPVQLSATATVHAVRRVTGSAKLAQNRLTLAGVLDLTSTSAGSATSGGILIRPLPRVSHGGAEVRTGPSFVATAGVSRSDAAGSNSHAQPQGFYERTGDVVEFVLESSVAIRGDSALHRVLPGLADIGHAGSRIRVQVPERFADWFEQTMSGLAPGGHHASGLAPYSGPVPSLPSALWATPGFKDVLPATLRILDAVVAQHRVATGKAPSRAEIGRARKQLNDSFNTGVTLGWADAVSEMGPRTIKVVLGGAEYEIGVDWKQLGEESVLGVDPAEYSVGGALESRTTAGLTRTVANTLTGDLSVAAQVQVTDQLANAIPNVVAGISGSDTNTFATAAGGGGALSTSLSVEGPGVITERQGYFVVGVRPVRIRKPSVWRRVFRRVRPPVVVEPVVVRTSQLRVTPLVPVITAPRPERIGPRLPGVLRVDVPREAKRLLGGVTFRTFQPGSIMPLEFGDPARIDALNEIFESVQREARIIAGARDPEDLPFHRLTAGELRNHWPRMAASDDPLGYLGAQSIAPGSYIWDRHGTYRIRVEVGDPQLVETVPVGAKWTAGATGYGWNEAGRGHDGNLGAGVTAGAIVAGMGLRYGRSAGRARVTNRAYKLASDVVTREPVMIYEGAAYLTITVHEGQKGPLARGRGTRTFRVLLPDGVRFAASLGHAVEQGLPLPDALPAWADLPERIAVPWSGLGSPRITIPPAVAAEVGDAVGELLGPGSDFELTPDLATDVASLGPRRVSVTKELERPRWLGRQVSEDGRDDEGRHGYRADVGYLVQLLKREGGHYVPDPEAEPVRVVNRLGAGFTLTGDVARQAGLAIDAGRPRYLPANVGPGLPHDLPVRMLGIEQLRRIALDVLGQVPGFTKEPTEGAFDDHARYVDAGIGAPTGGPLLHEAADGAWTVVVPRKTAAGATELLAISVHAELDPGGGPYFHRGAADLPDFSLQHGLRTNAQARTAEDRSAGWAFTVKPVDYTFGLGGLSSYDGGGFGPTSALSVGRTRSSATADTDTRRMVHGVGRAGATDVFTVPARVSVSAEVRSVPPELADKITLGLVQLLDHTRHVSLPEHLRSFTTDVQVLVPHERTAAEPPSRIAPAEIVRGQWVSGLPAGDDVADLGATQPLSATFVTGNTFTAEVLETFGRLEGTTRVLDRAAVAGLERLLAQKNLAGLFLRSVGTSTGGVVDLFDSVPIAYDNAMNPTLSTREFRLTAKLRIVEARPDGPVEEVSGSTARQHVQDTSWTTSATRSHGLTGGTVQRGAVGGQGLRDELTVGLQNTTTAAVASKQWDGVFESETSEPGTARNIHARAEILFEAQVVEHSRPITVAKAAQRLITKVGGLVGVRGTPADTTPGIVRDSVKRLVTTDMTVALTAADAGRASLRLASEGHEQATAVPVTFGTRAGKTTVDLRDRDNQRAMTELLDETLRALENRRGWAAPVLVEFLGASRAKMAPRAEAMERADTTGEEFLRLLAARLTDRDQAGLLESVRTSSVFAGPALSGAADPRARVQARVVVPALEEAAEVLPEPDRESLDSASDAVPSSDLLGGTELPRLPGHAVVGFSGARATADVDSPALIDLADKVADHLRLLPADYVADPRNPLVRLTFTGYTKASWGGTHHRANLRDELARDLRARLSAGRQSERDPNYSFSRSRRSGNLRFDEAIRRAAQAEAAFSDHLRARLPRGAVNSLLAVKTELRADFGEIPAELVNARAIARPRVVARIVHQPDLRYLLESPMPDPVGPDTTSEQADKAAVEVPEPSAEPRTQRPEPPDLVARFAAELTQAFGLDEPTSSDDSRPNDEPPAMIGHRMPLAADPTGPHEFNPDRAADLARRLAGAHVLLGKDLGAIPLTTARLTSAIARLRQIVAIVDRLESGTWFRDFLLDPPARLRAGIDPRLERVGRILADIERLRRPVSLWSARRARLDQLHVARLAVLGRELAVWQHQVGEIAGAVDAREPVATQRMIPSANDLELVRLLTEPASAIDLLTARRDGLRTERDARSSVNAATTQMLARELARAEEDLQLYPVLAGRGLDRLHPSQRVPLVLAERRGLAYFESHTAELRDMLSQQPWGGGYVVSRPARFEAVLARAHRFMVSELRLATNRRLDQLVRMPDGRRITYLEMQLGKETSDSGWVTGSTAGVGKRVRGAFEELLGNVTVGRRRGEFQNPGDVANRFEPEQPELLPMAASLIAPTWEPMGTDPMYGPYVFVWDASVSERSTFTGGQSSQLTVSGAPGVTGHGGWRSLLRAMHPDRLRLVLGLATEFEHDPGLEAELAAGDAYRAPFVEGQIYGPVSWAQLEHVVVNFSDTGARGFPTRDRADEVKARLEEKARESHLGFTVTLHRVADSLDGAPHGAGPVTEHDLPAEHSSRSGAPARKAPSGPERGRRGRSDALEPGRRGRSAGDPVGSAGAETLRFWPIEHPHPDVSGITFYGTPDFFGRPHARIARESWRKHDTSGRFHHREPAGRGTQPLLGIDGKVVTGRLPWAGEPVYYVDLHATPSWLTAPLRHRSPSPIGRNPGSVARLGAGHLVEIVRTEPGFRAALAQHGARLNVVLFACEAGLPGFGHLAEVFANSIGVPGLRVHASEHVLTLGTDGRVGVVAPLTARRPFRLFTAPEPGRARLIVPGTRGAVSLRLVEQSQFHLPLVSLSDVLPSGIEPHDVFVLDAARHGAGVLGSVADPVTGWRGEPWDMRRLAAELPGLGYAGGPLLLLVNGAGRLEGGVPAAAELAWYLGELGEVPDGAVVVAPTGWVLQHPFPRRAEDPRPDVEAPSGSLAVETLQEGGDAWSLIPAQPRRRRSSSEVDGPLSLPISGARTPKAGASFPGSPMPGTPVAMTPRRLSVAETEEAKRENVPIGPIQQYLHLRPHEPVRAAIDWLNAVTTGDQLAVHRPRGGEAGRDRAAPDRPGAGVLRLPGGSRAELLAPGLAWLREDAPGDAGKPAVDPRVLATDAVFKLVIGTGARQLPGATWSWLTDAVTSGRAGPILREAGWEGEPLAVVPLVPLPAEADATLRSLAETAGTWVYTMDSGRWSATPPGPEAARPPLVPDRSGTLTGYPVDVSPMMMNHHPADQPMGARGGEVVDPLHDRQATWNEVSRLRALLASRAKVPDLAGDIDDLLWTLGDDTGRLEEFLTNPDSGLRQGEAARTRLIESIDRHLRLLPGRTGAGADWRQRHLGEHRADLVAEREQIETELRRRAMAERATNQMIPSARDLQVLRLLQGGDVPEGDLSAADLVVHGELARTPIATLPDEQALPLLVVTRRAIQNRERDRVALRAKIERAADQDGMGWARNYPAGDELDAVIDEVLAHLRENLSVAMNIALLRPSGPANVLRGLLDDPQHAFRNQWEVESGSAHLFAQRGAAEQRMGYPEHLMGQVAGTFQDMYDESNRFEPPAPALLPRYTALVTDLHVGGPAQQYGETVFRFKIGPSDLATFTPSDSLEVDNPGGVGNVTTVANLAPLLAYGDPQLTRLYFHLGTGGRFETAEYARGLGEHGIAAGLTTYHEAQVHRPLTFDDVSKIDIYHVAGAGVEGEPSMTREVAERVAAELHAFAADHGYTFPVQVLPEGTLPAGDVGEVWLRADEPEGLPSLTGTAARLAGFAAFALPTRVTIVDLGAGIAFAGRIERELRAKIADELRSWGDGSADDSAKSVRIEHHEHHGRPGTAESSALVRVEFRPAQSPQAAGDVIAMPVYGIAADGPPDAETWLRDNDLIPESGEPDRNTRRLVDLVVELRRRTPGFYLQVAQAQQALAGVVPAGGVPRLPTSPEIGHLADALEAIADGRRPDAIRLGGRLRIAEAVAVARRIGRLPTTGPEVVTGVDATAVEAIAGRIRGQGSAALRAGSVEDWAAETIGRVAVPAEAAPDLSEGAKVVTATHLPGRHEPARSAGLVDLAAEVASWLTGRRSVRVVVEGWGDPDADPWVAAVDGIARAWHLASDFDARLADLVAVETFPAGRISFHIDLGARRPTADSVVGARIRADHNSVGRTMLAEQGLLRSRFGELAGEDVRLLERADSAGADDEHVAEFLSDGFGEVRRIVDSRQLSPARSWRPVATAWLLDGLPAAEIRADELVADEARAIARRAGLLDGDGFDRAPGQPGRLETIIQLRRTGGSGLAEAYAADEARELAGRTFAGDRFTVLPVDRIHYDNPGLVARIHRELESVPAAVRIAWWEVSGEPGPGTEDAVAWQQAAGTVLAGLSPEFDRDLAGATITRLAYTYFRGGTTDFVRLAAGSGISPADLTRWSELLRRNHEEATAARFRREAREIAGHSGFLSEVHFGLITRVHVEGLGDIEAVLRTGGRHAAEVRAQQLSEGFAAPEPDPLAAAPWGDLDLPDRDVAEVRVAFEPASAEPAATESVGELEPFEIVETATRLVPGGAVRALVVGFGDEGQEDPWDSAVLALARAEAIHGQLGDIGVPVTMEVGLGPPSLAGDWFRAGALLRFEFPLSPSGRAERWLIDRGLLSPDFDEPSDRESAMLDELTDLIDDGLDVLRFGQDLAHLVRLPAENRLAVGEFPALAQAWRAGGHDAMASTVDRSRARESAITFALDLLADRFLVRPGVPPAGLDRAEARKVATLAHILGNHGPERAEEVADRALTTRARAIAHAAGVPGHAGEISQVYRAAGEELAQVFALDLRRQIESGQAGTDRQVLSVEEIRYDDPAGVGRLVGVQAIAVEWSRLGETGAGQVWHSAARRTFEAIPDVTVDRAPAIGRVLARLAAAHARGTGADVSELAAEAGTPVATVRRWGHELAEEAGRHDLTDWLSGRLSALAEENVGPPPVDLTADLVGPDYFGLHGRPAVPDFLADVDLRDVPAGARAHFLRSLSLTGSRPVAGSLDPARLPADEHRVIAVRREGPGADWSGLGGAVPPLPEVLEVPRIVHAFWFGGPLEPHGAMGRFRINFAKGAAKYSGWEFVLGTDVTREDAEIARSGTPEPGTRMAAIHDFLDWADRSGVSVVNVLELLSLAPRTSLADQIVRYLRMALAKAVPLGFAEASDLTRWVMLWLFGGLYSDGDNSFVSPNRPTLDENTLDVVNSRAAFGIHRPHPHSLGNSGLLVPLRHPVAELMLEQLAGNYRKTRAELLPPEPQVVHPSMFATHSEMVLRRYSIMDRTGPDSHVKAFDRLGIRYQELTDVGAVTVGRAASWIYSPQPTAARFTGHEVLDVAKNVTATFVRGLRNDDGNLPLTLAAQAMDRLTDGQRAAVWTAALRFLADRDEHRLVRSAAVVSLRVSKGLVFGGTPAEDLVELPPAALALLEFPGSLEQARSERVNWVRGELRRPATMRPGVGHSRTPVPAETPPARPAIDRRLFAEALGSRDTDPVEAAGESIELAAVPVAVVGTGPSVGGLHDGLLAGPGWLRGRLAVDELAQAQGDRDFGVPAVAHPPRFLYGTDVRRLEPAQLPAFFAAVDLARPAPDRLHAGALVSRPDLVVSTDPVAATSWWGRPEPAPALPARLRLPRIAHTDLFGVQLLSPVELDPLLAELSSATASAEPPLARVAWTDLPREFFDRARASAGGEPAVGLAHRLVRWSEVTGTHLVSVPEVFSTAGLMRRWRDFGVATARQTRGGYEQARRILLSEVLFRFGGAYLLGELRLTGDFGGILEQVGVSRPGFAVFESASGVAVAAPQGHPALTGPDGESVPGDRRDWVRGLVALTGLRGADLRGLGDVVRGRMVTPRRLAPPVRTPGEVLDVARQLVDAMRADPGSASRIPEQLAEPEAREVEASARWMTTANPDELAAAAWDLAGLIRAEIVAKRLGHRPVPIDQLRDIGDIIRLIRRTSHSGDAEFVSGRIARLEAEIGDVGDDRWRREHLTEELAFWRGRQR